MDEEKKEVPFSPGAQIAREDAMEALSRIDDSLNRIRTDLEAIHDVDAMGRLRRDLDSLGKYTEALRRGVFRWWKLSLSKDAATLWLSVIALSVSAYSLYRTFFPTSDVRLAGGSIIQMRFYPQTNQLEVDFRSVIANYGGRMDVMRVAQGKLSWGQVQAVQPIIFPTDSFSFSVARNPIALPFALKENSAIELDVKALRILGTGLRDSFFDSSFSTTLNTTRRYKFELQLRSETKTAPTLIFCFEFSQEVLSELNHGNPIYPNLTRCEQ